ncbi:hypothetical protein [Lyticum sinuosum]|nr:hypothetical protein [Lyticum sinuosum]
MLFSSLIRIDNNDIRVHHNNDIGIHHNNDIGILYRILFHCSVSNKIIIFLHLI